MKRVLTTLVAAVCLIIPLKEGRADDYPSRPIRLVVPYSAGGPLDIVARVYALKLGEALRQPVIVENRPGGSALIGIKTALQAPPDGYTLLMSTTTFTTNTLVYKEPGYSIEDFVVVAGLGSTGLMLMESKKVPAQNFGELLAYAKANPKKLNIGTLGRGGITQMLTSRLQYTTGIQVTEVAYKGASPAMQDLLGGTIDLYIDAITTAISHVRGGGVTALASTAEARSPQAPDIPTFKELGVPDMAASAWFVVHASAKTPQPIIDKLRQQYTAIIASKDTQEQLARVQVDPWSGDLNSFIKYLDRDKMLWEQDAKRSGFVGSP